MKLIDTLTARRHISGKKISVCCEPFLLSMNNWYLLQNVKMVTVGHPYLHINMFGEFIQHFLLCDPKRLWVFLRLIIQHLYEMEWLCLVQSAAKCSSQAVKWAAPRTWVAALLGPRSLIPCAVLASTSYFMRHLFSFNFKRRVLQILIQLRAGWSSALFTSI